ncbi:MAG: ATP-dependent Clp protease ATP-binding subunit ClpA [Alphaproteobacteria bacterium]
MFSKALHTTVMRAVSLSKIRGHEFTTLEHLLLSLLEDKDASKVFDATQINVDRLREDLEQFLELDLTHMLGSHNVDPKPTAGLQRVLRRAAVHMQHAGRDEVTGANVLVALYAERDSYAIYFLQLQEMTRLDVVNFIAHGITKGDSGNKNHTPSAKMDDHEMPDFDHIESNNKDNSDADSGSDHKESARDLGDDSPLGQYCVNLNEKAYLGQIDPLIGRAQEVERVIQVLCRRTKNNPLLVGDPGVGKTAIAEGLALRIEEQDVPSVLNDAVIYSLDLGALLAGTRYRGDFEERVKKVLKELSTVPDSILFIDEIHTLVGAGSTTGGAMDASNLLKPALATGDLRCFGSTTYKEFRNHFDKDRALTRRFQKIDVAEPSISDTLKILNGLKTHYEDFHYVRYTADALKSAVELSARYINDRKLPDKAIDVIDEVGAAQQLLSKRKRRKVIGVPDIEKVVARIARIPPKHVSRDDRTQLAQLSDSLKTLVFGQDAAIEALSSSIKLSRAGLRDGEKPIGSYLFSGPTGVGKTEVARQLATQMGLELKRFDMSEYMERHSVSRLIGAPPGYVGYDEGGLLTEAIDQYPHCVLLLDEIEKAHPDVYNLLLQIMDYGKLTDNNGKTVNFQNVILILTTNAGASELSKPALGFERAARTGEDNEAIERTFTPEFRNRLDAIIGFAPLSTEVIAQIVDKFVFQLEAQLGSQDVTITLSAAARSYLGKKGYDPNFGARPLGRLVQNEIKQPLADAILFGDLVNGGLVKIGFNAKQQALTFAYEPNPPKAAPKPKPKSGSKMIKSVRGKPAATARR